MIWIVVLLVLLLVLLLVVSKYEVVPQLAAILNIFSFVMGFYLVDRDSLAWLNIYFHATVFIVFSLIVFPRKNKIRDYQRNRKIVYYPNRVSSFNTTFFYVVVFFIAYHFLVGGIPAFSSDVQTSRFDFTSSGLFGVPGRMMQYGRYYILFYSFYFFDRSKQEKSYIKYKKYFFISIIINLICGLFSGSKSSVFALVWLFVYCLAFSSKRYNIRKFIKMKFILPITLVTIGGFAYFYFYFKTYNNQFSNMNVFEYIMYRMTYLTVEGGTFLLKNGTKKIPYIIDFIYYLQKYFHINFYDASIYPLEIYASNSINHINFTTASAYYVPITVGAFPEFIYRFKMFSFIPTLLLGILYSKVFQKIKNSSRPFEFSALGMLIVTFNDFVGKGNLAHHVINFSLVYIMMKCIYIFGDRVKMIKFD